MVDCLRGSAGKIYRPARCGTSEGKKRIKAGLHSEQLNNRGVPG